MADLDKPADLDTVILCGGRGTRAYPDTLDVPKPLLEVGGKPIIEHVMDTYLRQGCRSFVLAAGYRAELFFERYADPPGNEPVRVTVLDTGLDADTGTRLVAAAATCRGSRFFATYGDGVGNVDLDRLLTFHRHHGGAMTVTTVPLPSPYGTLVSGADGRITEFREKPRLTDHWINAGFFALERSALDHWPGTSLEQDVLPSLAARGMLFAHRHTGFWKSMDTFKDRQELESLAVGSPPWARPLPIEA